MRPYSLVDLINASEECDASIISGEENTNGGSMLLPHVGDDPPEYVLAYPSKNNHHSYRRENLRVSEISYSQTTYAISAQRLPLKNYKHFDKSEVHDFVLLNLLHIQIF
jgi:hypothetical protein